MSNPILAAIADRRSNRGYKPEQISKEQIDALMTAAVQSPSARNAQPWHFSVVQNTGILDEINAEVAQNMGRERTDIFYGAPTVIFISSDASNRWGHIDSGIATQNLALAAHSMGLGSVILGFPDAAFSGSRSDYFKQKLKFPEGYNFAIAIAIGVPTTTKEAHPVLPGKISFVE